MEHIYALAMFYAAVNGPHSFDERFGQWGQDKPRPSPAIVAFAPVRTVPTIRITVPER